jgi:hypothetical protein
MEHSPQIGRAGEQKEEENNGISERERQAV